MMPSLRFSVNLFEIIGLTLGLTLQRPSLNNPGKPRLEPGKGEIFHVAFLSGKGVGWASPMGVIAVSSLTLFDGY